MSQLRAELTMDPIKTRLRHECLARQRTHTGGTNTILLHLSTRYQHAISHQTPLPNHTAHKSTQLPIDGGETIIAYPKQGRNVRRPGKSNPD